MRSQGNSRSFDHKRYNNYNYRYVINERIQGDTFRLINDQGEQIGVVSRIEALEYAKNNEVDLVLIAAHAQPQVVKAIDFHKFLYQEEKKSREGKKGQKKSGTKDIQLSLFIGEQDLERLRKKAQDFLQEGFQVRVKLPLRGRELGKQAMAHELIKKFISSLEDIMVAVEPKMQGRVIFAVVVRKTKNKL